MVNICSMMIIALYYIGLYIFLSKKHNVQRLELLSDQSFWFPSVVFVAVRTNVKMFQVWLYSNFLSRAHHVHRLKWIYKHVFFVSEGCFCCCTNNISNVSGLPLLTVGYMPITFYFLLGFNASLVFIRLSMLS